MEKYSISRTIDSKAQKWMKEIVQQLEEAGTLKDVNTSTLDMLALTYDRYIKANSQVDLEGQTITTRYDGIKPHPLIKVAKESLTQCMQILSECGLTVKSKNKLKKVDTNKEEDSPLEQFIKGQKETR